MLTNIFDGDFVKMQQLNNFFTVYIPQMINVAIGGLKGVDFSFLL